MIKVKNLSKTFNKKIILDGINFEIGKGEVVSLLGPNGAGKTTTLRILATYFPPTAGEVFINGFGVVKNSNEVRKCIGYLPENVPIYRDMRVKNYLKFRALLRKIYGKALSKSIGDAIELCGLEDVKKQMIFTLSKGYRQRLGIADALIHNPELLILDEPTVGLDPLQVREMRKIFSYLAERHTILVSTHFLQEAEINCKKFLIMNAGKIVAEGTKHNLLKKIRQSGDVFLEIKADSKTAIKKINLLTGVAKATLMQENFGWLKIKIRPLPSTDIRDVLFETCLKGNWQIRQIRQTEPNLEDIFNELTFSSTL